MEKQSGELIRQSKQNSITEIFINLFANCKQSGEGLLYGEGLLHKKYYCIVAGLHSTGFTVINGGINKGNITLCTAFKFYLIKLGFVL